MQGVPAHEIKVEPLPIDAGFFATRIWGMAAPASKQLHAALGALGLLDSRSLLAHDPRLARTKLICPQQGRMQLRGVPCRSVSRWRAPAHRILKEHNLTLLEAVSEELNVVGRGQVQPGARRPAPPTADLCRVRRRMQCTSCPRAPCQLLLRFWGASGSNDLRLPRAASRMASFSVHACQPCHEGTPRFPLRRAASSAPCMASAVTACSAYRHDCLQPQLACT